MKKLTAFLLIFVIICSLSSCAMPEMIDVTAIGYPSYGSDLDKYEKKLAKIEYAYNFLPLQSELSGYTDARYSYQYTSMLLFESKAIALFVEYPIEIYEKKKAEVFSSYEFLEKTEKSSEYYLTPPAEFTYEGYAFKTALEIEYGESHCKSFAFIGSNDEKCRIAYCYFYDFDLDLFADASLPENEAASEFIDDYFYWNDIDN